MHVSLPVSLFYRLPLVVSSTITNIFLPLFHCLYLSHFLFVDLYLVYSRNFTSLSRFTMFIIIVWFPFLNPIRILSCPPRILSMLPYLISFYDHIYEKCVPHSPDFIYILRAFICHLSVHLVFSVNTDFLI